MARAPIAMGAPAPASTPGAAPLIDLSVLDPAMRFAGDASYRAIRALAPIARDAYDTWCVLVLGTCVGLVLGVLFVRSARLAREARAKATAAAKKLKASAEKLTASAKKLKELKKKNTGGGDDGDGDGGDEKTYAGLPEEVMKVALQHLPKWTKQPDHSRTAWLNKSIDCFWPGLDTAASQCIRDSVEPMLRTMMPSFVNWIGFEKITLGPTPLVVGGAKTHGSNSEDAMLELEIAWTSGVDVILSAYVFGVRIPIRLHDVQLKTTVRLDFNPLVDELPCLGAVDVSLLDELALLDFGLTIPPGIDLMALPGVQQLVKHVVRGSLKTMTYPEKMSCPIMTNSGHEPRATGMIKLTARGGKNFEKMVGYKKGMFGGEQYVVQVSTRERRKIRLSRKHGNDPVWGELNYFLAHEDTVLAVVLYDKGMRVVGRCECALGPLVTEDAAGESRLLCLPIEPPEAYECEPPKRRQPDPDAKDPAADWQAIKTEFELATQTHAMKAAELRSKTLVRALKGDENEMRDVPTLQCELEYVSFRSPEFGSFRTAFAGVNRATPKGILTVYVDRASSATDENNRVLRPVATCSVAGQSYTTAAPKMMTSTPRWGETFLFFNVSVEEKLTVTLSGAEAKSSKRGGEFMGEFTVPVREIAMDHEVYDGYVLKGLKNNGQVFCRLKFTFMQG